jgi:hypothetical protein
MTRFERSVHALHDRRTDPAIPDGIPRSQGAPGAADEIAVRAMKDKNLDMGDGALRQDTHAPVHVVGEKDAQGRGSDEDGLGG